MSDSKRSRKTSSHKTHKRRKVGAHSVTREEVKSLIRTSAEKKWQTLSSGALAAFSFTSPLAGGLWPLISPGASAAQRVGAQIVTDWIDFRLSIIPTPGNVARTRMLLIWDTESGNAAAPAAAPNYFVGTPNWLSPVDPTVFGKGNRFKLLKDDILNIPMTSLSAPATAGGVAAPFVKRYFLSFGKKGITSKLGAGGTGIYADIITGSLILLLLTDALTGGTAPFYQFVMNGQFRDAYV